MFSGGVGRERWYKIGLMTTAYKLLPILVTREGVLEYHGLKLLATAFFLPFGIKFYNRVIWSLIFFPK